MLENTIEPFASAVPSLRRLPETAPAALPATVNTPASGKAPSCDCRRTEVPAAGVVPSLMRTRRVIVVVLIAFQVKSTGSRLAPLVIVCKSMQLAMLTWGNDEPDGGITTAENSAPALAYSEYAPVASALPTVEGSGSVMGLLASARRTRRAPAAGPLGPRRVPRRVTPTATSKSSGRNSCASLDATRKGGNTLAEASAWGTTRTSYLSSGCSRARRGWSLVLAPSKVQVEPCGERRIMDGIATAGKAVGSGCATSTGSIDTAYPRSNWTSP